MFNEDDIIYSYTDKMAIEDGILVDISSLGIIFQDMPVNRMTGSVYHDLEDTLAPVIGENELLTGIKEIVKDRLARLVYKGDIWQVKLDDDKWWLIENEVSGWTIMYPSDY